MSRETRKQLIMFLAGVFVGVGVMLGVMLEMRVRERQRERDSSRIHRVEMGWKDELLKQSQEEERMSRGEAKEPGP